MLKYGADVNNIGFEIENIYDETIEVPEDNDPRSDDYVCNIINKYYELSPLNLAIKNNLMDNASILILNGANIESN